MYKLRFNLGKGENFMKWKLTYPDKTSVYLDPNETTIMMMGCELVNRKTTAKRIHAGENKTVCAHIKAEEVSVFDITSKPSKDLAEVAYNPRIKPHWRDEYHNDLDGLKFAALITHGNKVYATEDGLKRVLDES